MGLELGDNRGHRLGIAAAGMVHDIGRSAQPFRIGQLGQDRWAVPHCRQCLGCGGFGSTAARGIDDGGAGRAGHAHGHEPSEHFGTERRQQAQQKAQRNRSAHDQPALGTAGGQRQGGGADDAAFRCGDAVLVFGLAQAADKGFVLRLGGIGIGLQRLQFHARLVLAIGLPFHLVQACLQRIQMRLGGGDVIAHRAGNAGDFLRDLGVQVALLRLHRDEFGMQRPVFAGEIGFLPDQIGLLAAQLHDHRGCDHLADITGIARGGRRAHPFILGLLFGQLRAGLHDLGVDRRHLLIHQRIAGRGIIKAVLRLVLLHRRLFLHQLLRQFIGALVEPIGCGLASALPDIDLILHIGLRHRIGDGLRLLGIVGSGIDRDGGRKPVGIGRHMFQEVCQDAIMDHRDIRGAIVGKPVVPPQHRRRSRRHDHRIEFGIVVKLQLGDDLGGDLARRDDLNLVLQGRRIGGQLRQHGGQIGDVVLALIQHDHCRTGILPGQQQRHQSRQHDHGQRHAQDQPAARLHDAQEIGKRKARRWRRRRIARHIGRCRPVGGHEPVKPSKGPQIRWSR